MQPFVLTPEQVESYRENGFLHVKGLFTPEEAAFYCAETHALAARLRQGGSIDATWGSAREAAGEETRTVIEHCHDVQFYSGAFSRLIVDERLTAAAAGVMGTPNVQLHHTKMFIKPPEKGSPFPLHQDYNYFPHQNDSMIAAIIHFDDAPIEKGCVRMVPGSHKLGPLPHDSTGGWHLPMDKYPIESAVAQPAKAGDVLLFSYLTIHGSGINESDQYRTTLLVQMRDPADPPLEDVHRSRGQGMMLRGINPVIQHG